MSLLLLLARRQPSIHTYQIDAESFVLSSVVADADLQYDPHVIEEYDFNIAGTISPSIVSDADFVFFPFIVPQPSLPSSGRYWLPKKIRKVLPAVLPPRQKYWSMECYGWTTRTADPVAVLRVDITREGVGSATHTYGFTPATRVIRTRTIPVGQTISQVVPAAWLINRRMHGRSGMTISSVMDAMLQRDLRQARRAASTETVVGQMDTSIDSRRRLLAADDDAWLLQEVA